MPQQAHHHSNYLPPLQDHHLSPLPHQTNVPIVWAASSALLTMSHSSENHFCNEHLSTTSCCASSSQWSCSSIAFIPLQTSSSHSHGGGSVESSDSVSPMSCQILSSMSNEKRLSISMKRGGVTHFLSSLITWIISTSTFMPGSGCLGRVV